jgi:hypothetical protein
MHRVWRWMVLLRFCVWLVDQSSYGLDYVAYMLLSGCFYGLNYAFAYACFYDASMGHCTWYLVPV